MIEDFEFRQRVREIIAETFSIGASDVRDDTTADDVPGWDSLGHSILLARLSRKLDVEIGEDIAGQADVGTLIDRLSAGRRTDAG